jgi:hypothetical protein
MKGLSITQKKNGRFYAHCHSCQATLTQIVALDLGSNGVHVEEEIPDPTPLGQGMQWWVRKTGVTQDIWEGLGCVEAHGGVAFTFPHTPQSKVRRRPKQITWTHPDLEAPALWPHPPDEMEKHVWIVEGESDCGTINASGIAAAYATTKGAGATLPEGWAEGLMARGVERLTVCGDSDESGQKFEQKVSKEALDAGLEVFAVRVQDIVDPFSGINDLNGLWREVDSLQQFHDVIATATHEIASDSLAYSYADMVALAEQEVDWLIPGLLATSDKALLTGPQKSFKTWTVLEIIRSLIKLRPFLNNLDWKPTKTRRICLVEEEGNPGQLIKRIRRLGLTEEEIDAHLKVIHRKGIRFTDDDSISRLIAFCRRYQTEVIIFDPLQRMIPGVNENDSSETGVVWDQVFRIQQQLPGIVVMIVHHANKGERLTWESVRGSSRHAGEVDLGIFVDRDNNSRDAMKMVIDGRDVALDLDAGHAFDVDVVITEEEFTLSITGASIQARPTGRGSTQRERVIEAVRDGCETRTEIMRECNLSDTTVRKHLRDLTDEGLMSEEDGDSKKAPKHYRIVT